MFINNLFKSWKSEYISRLEKENDRLIRELRHWQNQCLVVLRVAPVPDGIVSVNTEPKKNNIMPKRETFHTKQKEDNKKEDVRWAFDLVANEMELKRTRDEVNRG